MGRANNRYYPSNGTEGEMFMEAFCYRCARDAKYQETQDGEDSCPILIKTLTLDDADPDYPPEWTYDSDGDPICTAFEEADDE